MSLLESEFKNGGMFGHGNDFWNETPEERAEFGLSTDTNNPDQMFIEWLQSKFPEGKPIVYQGNQYYGTGGGGVDSSSTVTEGKPVTLENVNNTGSGTSDKSETKEGSTLENVNNTGSGTSEKETGTSDDYGWVTHLNEEDDSDTKKETPQYPNEMSQEEFNAMYEYALGMTGRGGNQQLDDYGEKTGFWGDFETIPLTVQDTQEEIDNLKSQYKTLEGRGTLSEAAANNIQSKIKNYESMVKQSQEQLDALNTFIDNYASIYSPIEKEESKNQAVIDKVNAAEKEYEQAWDAQETTWANLTQALMKAGMDYNLSAEDILASNTSKFELSKEAKNYASKAAESIVKAISQRGFKGDNFTLPVDISAKEFGSYLIQTAPEKVIGVSAYNVRVISPKGEEIARGVITTPNGLANNGSWDIKDAKGKTIASGESTFAFAFARSVTKALSNVAIADYENSNSTGSVPEEVRSAAQAVIDAQSNLADKEEKLAAAQKERVNTTHTAATESKQDIMDRYQRGELNPYQAAVALSNIKDSMLAFDVDRITSKIDYNNFKDANKIPGDTGRGTIGIDSFISDLSPVGRDNPASETNISSDITSESVSLNDMKERLDEIDVSNIKSQEQAEALSNDLSNYLSDLSVEANNELQTLVTSLLETGGKLQNVRNDPKFKSLSTEIYTLAQAVYDKTSAIEEYTGKYFGDIDISSRRAIKKNIEEVSNKIAEMQGAEHIVHTDDKGRESFVLNKEEIKALANYGKTIDATKDAAIALMKSAAFNGAENVTGDKYSETWKKEFADMEYHNEDASFKDNIQDLASGLIGTKDSGKFTFGDFLAAASKGMLGVVTMGLGIAAIPYNPVLGTMLTFAGVNSMGREVLKFGTKMARTNSTNEEVMFGQKYDKGRQVWNEIYNRSFEKANYGDPKSVATWTAAVGVIGGLVEMMTGGIGFADGIVRIQQNVEILKSNGLAGNVDTTIRNVYELGKNIITWSKMNININDYMKDPNDPNLIAKGRNVNVLTDDDISIKPNYATYGEATSDDSSVLDNKYSGYSEQAKNSNLAKDYNAGMEQETNEAVSDKYVKVFKVMFDKEPDYIRKVLIAIPKNHFEMRWEK